MHGPLKYEPPVVVPFQSSGGSLVLGIWVCSTGPNTSTLDCSSGWTAGRLCGTGCANESTPVCVPGSSYITGGCRTGLQASSVCISGTSVATIICSPLMSCCPGSGGKSSYPSCINGSSEYACKSGGDPCQNCIGENSCSPPVS